ncbi:MAG: hypothetical protein IJX96_00470 [Clostridia bacterium]|nr:hypothetical protein [Clostridia bacterium]
MSYLQTILQYQEIDGKLFKLESEIAESEERKKYVKLQKFLKVAPEKLDSLDGKATSLKEEADALAKKYEQIESLLADFENLDELIGGGADVSFYKKKAQSVVEQLRKLKADLGVLSASIKDTDAEYQKLKKQVISAQKQYAEAAEAYKAVKGAREAEKKALEAELTKAAEAAKKADGETLARYLTKRKEKIFPVVGALYQGRCPFCSMEPPIAAKSKLPTGIDCDNCHRIIFSE